MSILERDFRRGITNRVAPTEKERREYAQGLESGRIERWYPQRIQANRQQVEVSKANGHEVYPYELAKGVMPTAAEAALTEGLKSRVAGEGSLVGK